MNYTLSGEKIHGYEVEVRFHDGNTKRFSKVGSEAAVRRWAMLKSLAKEVRFINTYTREEWIRVFGDGRVRT